MPATLALLALALIAGLRPASAINENAGTTGYNFLKIGVGARPAALGGAYAAVSGAVESSAWNPAGLRGVRDRAATVSLTRYLVETQAGFLGAVFPGEARTWGFSLN